jgi:hypothetical protein
MVDEMSYELHCFRYFWNYFGRKAYFLQEFDAIISAGQTATEWSYHPLIKAYANSGLNVACLANLFSGFRT